MKSYGPNFVKLALTPDPSPQPTPLINLRTGCFTLTEYATLKKITKTLE